MIERLEIYVLARQLGIAQTLAHEFLNESSTSPHKESGYAILSILMSYFEMIEQFDCGESSDGHSKEFFRRGFRKVYPQSSLNNVEIGRIYSWIRCGMYHSGMTKESSPLSRYFPNGFDVQSGEIRINPGLVVQDLRNHFDQWVTVLKKPACTGNRHLFERAAQMIGMDRGEVSAIPPARGTPAPWEPG